MIKPIFLSTKVQASSAILPSPVAPEARGDDGSVRQAFQTEGWDCLQRSGVTCRDGPLSTHGGHLPKALCSQYRPHRRQAGSHREITSLRTCTVPVGAGLRMTATGRIRSVVAGCFRPVADVRLEIFSAYEIERRPRGASRINPLLRLFLANYVWGVRATALVHDAISSHTNKGSRASVTDVTGLKQT